MSAREFVGTARYGKHLFKGNSASNQVPFCNACTVSPQSPWKQSHEDPVSVFMAARFLQKGAPEITVDC